MYLHERKNWTDFHWDAAEIAPLLNNVRLSQGKLLGRVSDLGFELDTQLEIDNLSTEVLASSEIEGVALNAASVRSSISKGLGLAPDTSAPTSLESEGAAAVLLDATQNFESPLTFERIAGWHNALFPTGYSGLQKITVAHYRTSGMQVVSGAVGHEKIHYEAPDAVEVPWLMDEFFDWVDGHGVDSLLKAAVAHVWFLTVHPFDDGNGRIARAITECLLARSDGSKRRFYSMAGYILANRNAYYNALERAQKGSADITEWIRWFLDALKCSLDDANVVIDGVLYRNTWWQAANGVRLNERQRFMLNKLLNDFEGKLTSGKWAKMTKVSSDTALRDINDLIQKGLLLRDLSASGRSTSYLLRQL